MKTAVKNEWVADAEVRALNADEAEAVNGGILSWLFGWKRSLISGMFSHKRSYGGHGGHGGYGGCGGCGCK